MLLLDLVLCVTDVFTGAALCTCLHHAVGTLICSHKRDNKVELEIILSNWLAYCRFGNLEKLLICTVTLSQYENVVSMFYKQRNHKSECCYVMLCWWYTHHAHCVCIHVQYYWRCDIAGTRLPNGDLSACPHNVNNSFIGWRLDLGEGKVKLRQVVFMVRVRVYVMSLKVMKTRLFLCVFVCTEHFYACIPCKCV